MSTLIYIVLLVGAIVGFSQGAFKQIANLAGTIVGLILAAMLYEQFGDALCDKTGAAAGIGHTVAFVLIAVVAPVLLGFLATFLTKLFKAVHLGFVNRLVGAGVGVICYGLVMSLAFNAYDFGMSKGGYSAESLGERPSMYYSMKRMSQFIVPDAIIVTDSTEVANGAEPKYGLKQVVDEAAGKINPFN